MPELPEVETVKKILNTFLPESEIIDVIVYKKGIIIGDVPSFKKALIGRTFKEVERIGKYLIFTFDTNLIMLSHLRMEGKFIEILPGNNDSRYAHVIFVLKDGRRLCYDDSRQFGKMEITTREKYLNTKSLQNVGPEPFTINPLEYFEKIKGRNTPIKLTLLDQKLMSGLGNIYVDEVLYLSKINPLTPTSLITLDQVKVLIKHSIEVLNNAIKAGGTTVRSYAPALGVSGNFQQKLHAYGRVDERCPTCNTLFKKIFVGGRGTTFCPHCQVNHNAPTLVAITGQKASGKTVISNYLRSLGEIVIDTDTLAKSLYKDPEVIKRLEKTFNVSLSNEHGFDIELLKNYLKENPKQIKVLNGLIHPLVKDEMLNIIKNSNAKMLYFEIPVLFSHKINELFDYIIGVEVSLTRQMQNLEKRGDTLGINPDQMYLKNRHKLDYIIINDGSIEDLINKFKTFKAQYL
ncbi:MAG: bifunctional DNA-formamidopyrimidine glycosylase/DNA-(apurinic or apyrimidinic site) lyase [Bacilli bacterium]|nr:bifunctional DNA-formamidopyrimidine glycosylase/DNA-(apurinic or apyrimidinic site) lyase [Bacilli bacterium]